MRLNYTASCLALALALPAFPLQAQETTEPATTPSGCESGMFDAQGVCIENAGEAADEDDDSEDTEVVPGNPDPDNPGNPDNPANPDQPDDSDGEASPQ